MFLGQAVNLYSKVWRLQRNYNWDFILPDIGMVTSGFLISPYCQNIRFGDYSIDTVSEMRYGAFKTKYAGFFDIQSVVATFLKPVPDTVSSYFYAWRRLIISEDGLFNPKISYAKDAYVFMYDSSGAPTSILKLSGIFPKKFPAYSLSYEREEVTKFEIEFNVDRIMVVM